MNTAILAVLSIALIIAPAAAQQPALGRPADPLNDFDAYVRQAMEDWGAVGLAVAVVKDGEVVFQEGYGQGQRGPRATRTPAGHVRHLHLHVIRYGTAQWLAPRLVRIRVRTSSSSEIMSAAVVSGWLLYRRNGSFMRRSPSRRAAV